MVPPPCEGITAELQDALCWQWVAQNTPELAHDAYAAAEVARQGATSRRTLLRRLATLFGFHGEHTNAVQWWRSGSRFALPACGGLSAALSAICNNWEGRVYFAPLDIEPYQRYRPQLEIPVLSYGVYGHPASVRRCYAPMRDGVPFVAMTGA